VLLALLDVRDGVLLTAVALRDDDNALVLVLCDELLVDA
jgi:hypothetical protein